MKSDRNVLLSCRSATVNDSFSILCSYPDATEALNLLSGFYSHLRPGISHQLSSWTLAEGDRKTIQNMASAARFQCLGQFQIAGTSRACCRTRTSQLMPRAKSNPQITLRPQDLVVLLRLVLELGPAPSYAALAAELGMTASELHGGVERAVAARLASKDASGKPAVIFAALRAFVQHGAPYCFPATRGTLTRGLPTSYGAPPLKDLIRPGTDPLPVWPHKDGTVRGIAIHPLYPSVPEAAGRNSALYELLALFDAARGGSARERALALELLEQGLQP